MIHLIDSDVWRDGGSLSATIADGSELKSFWLQTNDWDSPSEMDHLELYVSDGAKPELKETLIKLGSAAEAHWLSLLEQVSTESASDSSKETFSRLLKVLRKRQLPIHE